MNSARECVCFEMFSSNLQFANKLFLHIFSSMTELWKLLEEKLLCRTVWEENSSNEYFKTILHYFRVYSLSGFI